MVITDQLADLAFGFNRKNLSLRGRAALRIYAWEGGSFKNLCLRGHCPGLLKPNVLCMSMRQNYPSLRGSATELNCSTKHHCVSFRNQAEMAHTCRGTISLHGAIIHTEHGSSSSNCFIVSNGGGTQTFHLRANNEVERQKWVTSLELAKAKAIQVHV